MISIFIHSSILGYIDFDLFNKMEPPRPEVQALIRWNKYKKVDPKKF